MSKTITMTTIALAVLTMGTAMAQDQPQIYGNQLMTQQERLEYRNQMRAMKTQEERDAFRLQHHQQMQVRAKEKGMTLPDAPPAGGGGMGPGNAGGGMGQGMGGSRGAR